MLASSSACYSHRISWQRHYSSHAEVIVSKYWDSRPKTAIKQTNIGTAKRGRGSFRGGVTRTTKNTRTSQAAAGASKRKTIPIDDEDDAPEYEETYVDSMDKYQDVRDWEELVQSVDTIERGADNMLKVYMTM